MAERQATRARRLVDLRRKRDATAKAASTAEKKYDEAEKDFWESLDDEEQSSVTLELGDGYGKVQLVRRETVTARVIDEDAAVAALEDEGLAEGFLGGPKIRKKALNEHVRDLLQSQQALPDGVDFNARRYIAITFKKED